MASREAHCGTLIPIPALVFSGSIHSGGVPGVPRRPKAFPYAEMTCAVLGWENVTIGTMTYKNCCHVVTKMADGSFTSDEWLAPSIGLVESEDVVAVGPKRTKTLVEFKPGK